MLNTFCSNKLQKRSFCCKKEVLKTRGSEEADVIRSSSSEAVHQKLKDWRLQMLFKWCFNHAYFCRRLDHEATANSKEFESIGWYSLENVGNGQLYEVYNHYLPYSDLYLLIQEQPLCLHWYSSIHGMDLKLILYRTTTKSGNKSLVIWSSFKWLFFWCVGNQQRLFHTSI